MSNKFIDYTKEPMLFPELEKSIMEDEQMELEENFKTISEVAKDLELATSVIRYWETKFPCLSPVKRNNRRYYSNKDQKTISTIKNLLYIQGYTIKAVQDLLESGSAKDINSANNNNYQKQVIKDVIGKLEEIRGTLK